MNTPTVLRASRAPSMAPGRQVPLGALRAYFFSDSRRTIQSVLALIWLLDAGLQFQSFMYSNGFIQMLTGMQPGQPHWLASSMNWATGIANGHLDFWNTLFALTQVADRARPPLPPHRQGRPRRIVRLGASSCGCSGKAPG